MNSSLAIEYIGVRAHTDILNDLVFFVDPVNKEPIGFEMALSVIDPIPYQKMIVVFGRKRVPGNQQFMDRLELAQGFLLPLAPSHITPKLC